MDSTVCIIFNVYEMYKILHNFTVVDYIIIQHREWLLSYYSRKILERHYLNN